MSDAVQASTRPRVVITSHSLRRLRASQQLTRWILYAVATVGILATLRNTIAPPHIAIPKPAPISRADPAAEGFARLFALRYLTWDSARPEWYAHALAPFLGDGADATAGARLPLSGAQSVTWAQVVQSRDIGAAERVYTVAAQTTAAGLVYLSVDVIHDRARGLSLGRYPAFVGPPATHPASALSSDGTREVADQALTRVVERTLRNYLSGSTSNLAADLVPGSRVSPPSNPLSLQRITQLQWRGDRAGVIATVLADDSRGADYTLSYELDVVSAGDRWEVAAIQTDPTS